VAEEPRNKTNAPQEIPIRLDVRAHGLEAKMKILYTLAVIQTWFVVATLSSWKLRDHDFGFHSASFSTREDDDFSD